jgi:DNA-binding transcriptional LysR family regulator
MSRARRPLRVDIDRFQPSPLLTEGGQRLLPHAQQLLASAAETVESARAIGRGVFECLELGITRWPPSPSFPTRHGTSRPRTLASHWR